MLWRMWASATSQRRGCLPGGTEESQKTGAQGEAPEVALCRRRFFNLEEIVDKLAVKMILFMLILHFFFFDLLI